MYQFQQPYVQNAENTEGQPSEVPPTEVPPSNIQQEAPVTPVQQPGSKKTALIIAAAIIIVIIVVVVAVLMFTGLLKTIQTGSSLFGLLSANKEITMGNFVKLVSVSGLNASSFAISYAGNVLLNVNNVQVTMPFGITEEKHNNNSRLDLEIYKVPLIGGNLSVIEIKNATKYYSCSKSSLSMLGNSSKNETYICTKSNESIYSIFNTSNSSISKLLNSTIIHITSINESTHDGTPCTNLAGYFTYTGSNNVSTLSSLSSQANLNYVSNVVFNSCISDTQRIPLTANIYVYNNTGNRNLGVSVNLNEVSFSKTVPANITVLPGPIINYSLSTGGSYGAPVYTNGCANDAFSNAITCSSAMLFENGTLNMVLSQHLNHPIYISQITCFTTNYYSHNSNNTYNSYNGTVNGKSIGNFTSPTYPEVNNSFHLSMPCYSNEGRFSFLKGEALNASVDIAFMNTSSNSIALNNFVWITASTAAK